MESPAIRLDIICFLSQSLKVYIITYGVYLLVKSKLGFYLIQFLTDNCFMVILQIF